MEKLVRQLERTARLLQAEAAKERIRGGDEQRAALFESVARLSLDCCAEAVVDASNPTPPGGTWLAYLDDSLRNPGTLVAPAHRFLIRRAQEARFLIKQALDMAKFTGDFEWLGAAERWIERIDQGYDVEHDTSETPRQGG